MKNFWNVHQVLKQLFVELLAESQKGFLGL